MMGDTLMSADLAQFIRLAPLGFVVGAYGTLVGAGGGALLVPALLLLMPEQSPALLTSMSLAVVFFNAYSGTIAYARMKRIDYFAGLLFGLAGIPGAILGTMLVQDMPRAVFDPTFGALLLLTSLFLAMNPLPSVTDARAAGGNGRQSPNLLAGSIGSAYIAVISSLLGIGGGIIHVPFLIRVLRYPPHVATATSHFVLTIIALVAVITHLIAGELSHGLQETMCLAVGVMMGAPLGAAVSSRIRGSLIVRLLALALGFVGLRLLAQAIM